MNEGHCVVTSPSYLHHPLLSAGPLKGSTDLFIQIIMLNFILSCSKYSLTPNTIISRII